MIKRASSDGGAALMMVAMSMMLLLGGAALAIDIGGLWLDRSADQKISDSAAAAGALGAVVTDGQAGCEAALAYAAINAEELTTLDDSGCAAAFAGSCNPAVGKDHTVESGRYIITVTYPVLNSDALMTSGIIGATAQALDPGDGEPCDRLGVEISATRNSIFAGLLGFDQGTTTVHTVARASMDVEDGAPLNLLVLDRFGCQAINVEGNGGIIVDAVIELDEFGTPIGLLPGVAAADSDGSVGCDADGVIDVNGDSSLLRADGPQGCPSATGGTHAVGAYTADEGCGLIRTIAPGTPGCETSPANTPACTPGSGGLNKPKPVPTAMPGRLTRAPVDHRFNCWPDYTSPPAGTIWAVAALEVGNEQDIPGCVDGDPDHIYDLIKRVTQFGAIAGFTSWTSLGYPCTLNPPTPPIILPPGDIWVDCDPFIVKTVVQFNGNVVFDGDVTITSGTGDLDVNNSLGSPGWAFFRDGVLTKDANVDLTFNYTAVYMSKTSRLQISGGGSGSLTWIAPDSGKFDDLALWSDSTDTQFWSGQSTLVMVGVFFSPLATADYSGNSGVNQTDAQWIADKLTARGEARMGIRPAVNRGVIFGGTPPTELIR